MVPMNDFMKEFHQEVLLDQIEDNNLTGVVAQLNTGTDVNINVGGRLPYTALGFALMARDPEIAELLIMRGADVNAVQDESGWTPLMKVSVTRTSRLSDPRSSTLVKLLMRNRADISKKDIDGLTALHFAADRNDRLAVQALIEHNADCTIQDLEQDTVDPVIQEMIQEKRLEQTTEKNRPK